ncbi:MAG: hypothetical protein JNM27_11350 [Leptospirales bacterium]|nr:hypothetical protein [Leptospirales bacterium]
MRSRLPVNHEIVTIQLGHQVITGRITYRSSSDISVSIVDPFQQLSGRVHIPSFGRAWHDFHGTYGDETAENLLRRIYEAALFMNRNTETLRAELLVLNERLANLRAQEHYFSEEQLKLKTHELRSFFKSNQIDQRSYQRMLKDFRRRWSRCDLETRELQTAFARESIARRLDLNHIPIAYHELVRFLENAGK